MQREYVCPMLGACDPPTDNLRNLFINPSASESNLSLRACALCFLLCPSLVCVRLCASHLQTCLHAIPGDCSPLCRFMGPKKSIPCYDHIRRGAHLSPCGITVNLATCHSHLTDNNPSIRPAHSRSPLVVSRQFRTFLLRASPCSYRMPTDESFAPRVDEFETTAAR